MLVFLQSVVTVSSQTEHTEKPSSEVQPFTDLTLEISAPEKILLSLQPIPIAIMQSNKTNKPILGYKSVGFNGSPLYIYVQKSGGNSERVLITPLTPVSGFYVVTNAKLAPDESYEAKELITIGLHKYFPEPGTYELQAVLANDDRTQFIESNKVTIEIQMPTGADRNAYNLIKNSSFQDFLFSGAKFDKMKDTLETLIAMHPNSPYAKSSAFLLGETYFELKQYPRALVNLIRLENDKEFIFAEKVKKYLAEIRRLPLNQQQ